MYSKRKTSDKVAEVFFADILSEFSDALPFSDILF